jgi:hypothetical protein
MPSKALLDWRNVRLPRLAEVDAQCAATLALVPAPDLADENLRGYVMHLSAHFQGFCRDLHTECVQRLASATTPAMLPFIQTLGLSARELDRGNPRFEAVRQDFGRFALDLHAALLANPANAVRLTHLGHLNSARNHAAHHKPTPPVSGPLTLAGVQAWRGSCDGLATEFDGIMYNQLLAATGAPPW